MAYEGNRYANYNRKREDKASWLEPALTAAGAVVGSVVPGVGTAAGAAAGRALGSAGHSMANGGGAESLVMPGMQAFQTFRPSVPQTGISPQGGGTQPTLPTPDPSVPDFGGMDNASILQMFMQNPSQFRRGYANGGLVTGPGMDMASQWAQMDPVQRAMLQAQQAVGNGPVYPTVENGQLGALQQAKHPTLEALASLMPDLLGSLPKPADPRNTKAIGAWAPFAGQALAAPATIAQARRKGANAPIEARNVSAMSDYDARRKAYEERRTKYGSVALEAALKPAAGEGKLDRFNTPIPAALRQQLRSLGVPLPEKVVTYGELDEIQQSMTRNATSAAASGPKGPSPSDLISVGNQAETQYRLNPAVQKFETMSDALGKIAGSEPSGVGDLAMIFQFMKILDPTSVVRETEYANAENSSGRFRQMWNMWNKFKKGDKLTPSARLEFLSHAKRYYKEAEIKYGRARSQYERRLQQYGIDPTMYLMDYTLPKETMGFVDNELNPPPAAPEAKPYEPDTKAQGVWRGR